METNIPQTPQRSRLAITSFMLSLVAIPLGLLLIYIVVVPHSFLGAGPSFILNLVAIIVLPLLFLGCIFGLIAVRQINKSQGRLIGCRLASKGVKLSSFFIVIFTLAILAIRILCTCMCGDLYGYPSNSSRWSEGKAAMGTVATAIRAYAVEDPNSEPPKTLNDLGYKPGDLEGTYFCDADFSFFVKSMNPLKFMVLAQPSSDHKWKPKSQAHINESPQNWIDVKDPAQFIQDYMNTNNFNDKGNSPGK